MITILGSINMDLVVRTERFPTPGETVTGVDFETSPGGKGANQALAASRAGAHVKLVGATGRDNYSEQPLELLYKSGVDLTQTKRVGGSTGTAHILIDTNGENIITVVSGANGTLDACDAKSAIQSLSKGDTLVTQLEIPSSTIECALGEARKANVRSIINIAPYNSDAQHLSRMADVVIANETEFEQLCGECEIPNFTREAAMKYFSFGSSRTVVVTLGAKGVVAFHEGEFIHSSAPKINPVDTVGAGDTFCGYLAANLDAGVTFREALQFATIAGSLACLKHGAQPAIPYATEVISILSGESTLNMP